MGIGGGKGTNAFIHGMEVALQGQLEHRLVVPSVGVTLVDTPCLPLLPSPTATSATFPPLILCSMGASVGLQLEAGRDNLQRAPN